jgi:pilus assembly protein CpaE
MLLAPEMASIRGAVCALNIYDRLNYAPEKILPILNHAAPPSGIRQPQVEKVLKRPVRYSFPHMPSEFLRAINFGEPLVVTYPDSPVTAQFEDVAYTLSKEGLKNIPPAAPTAVWKRVTGRANRWR